MSDFYSLDAQELETFLERRRATPPFALDLSLADNLTAILRKANEFVPSQAGSILLDNPLVKKKDRRHNSLTFIATFGDMAEALLRREISAETGIAGHVYVTGESYCSADVEQDRLFYPAFDNANGYQTKSLVAIPVRIEHEVCGVLELVNRKESGNFSQQDVNLLEIFAGYIAISIQNVLDARQAQEIAKRDNLTGLYNDRYLHIALSRAISLCRHEHKDLALLFIDLDFFKRVNDTHGHLAGSQVLREVGELIDELTRRPGAISARYGGDEFVVALPGADLHDGIELAEKIRSRLVDSVFCEGPGEIQPDPIRITGLTGSIGVATVQRHLNAEMSVERSKSTLLRLADTAMYVAKETGRNRTAIASEPVRPREGEAEEETQELPAPQPLRSSPSRHASPEVDRAARQRAERGSD